MVGQLLSNHAVELLRDHTTVERIHLELDLIGSMHQVNLTGPGAEDFDLLTFLENNAPAGKLGFNADRRLVVDEIAVNHRFAVGIGENRLSKNLNRVEGRSGRKS